MIIFFLLRMGSMILQLSYLIDYSKEGDKSKHFNEKIISKQNKDVDKRIKYIDEELNRMDYKNALENDKRTY